MIELEILQFPDERLHRKAEIIETIDENLKELAQAMLEKMYATEGVGLAATQVGVLRRLIVMDISQEQNSPWVLINPEVIDAKGEITEQEGCLSLPGLYADVTRAEKVKIRASTLEGQVIEKEWDGLLAKCIQHEIDHLEGILFIQRLSPLKQSRLKAKFLKMKKKEKMS
ncbi:MAG: peptide deformylase [Haemophilus parainfluenzae]|jgi:peptide deformylase|nr:MAG: peptide deformylase [Haemophilus parainfluenzae]